MTSTPSGFKGDAAGRNMSGAASVTLAPLGKEITRLSATDELSATVALHCSATGGGGGGRAAPAAQAPALSAVVLALDQQLHAEQPATSSAEEAQQQPPRHRLVPQSAAEAQLSPGELRTQVPVPKWHAPQPCRTAFRVQQKEPRQAPEAQLAFNAQGVPGAREPAAAVGDGVAAAAEGAPEEGLAAGAAAPVAVAVAEGVAGGVAVEETDGERHAGASAASKYIPQLYRWYTPPLARAM